MKRLALSLVALASLAACAVPASAGGHHFRQNVVVRQQVVVQRQRVVVQRQRFVQPIYAQQFVAPVYQQQFVQPVQAYCAPQQFVQPVYSQQVIGGGCQSLYGGLQFRSY